MNSPSPALDALLAQQAWMSRLARQLVADEATRDDVVQSAWIELLQRPPRPGAGLRGFLATILRRRAAKFERETVRRQAREARAVDAPPESASPEALAGELEAQRSVVEAVLALDEPYRETIILRYFHDLGPSAISQARRVPIGTIETRLKRGLARLRDDLTRRSGGDARRWSLPLLPVAGRASFEGASLVGLAFGVTLMSKPIVAGLAIVLLVVATSLVVEWAAEDSGTTNSNVMLVDPPMGTEPESPQESALARAERTLVSVESAIQSDEKTARDAGPRAPTCRLRLLDSTGAPLRFANLVIQRANTFARDFRPSNENGEIDVQRRDGEVWLWIYDSAASTARVSTSLEGESATVMLPRGAVIAGRVEIDGRIPGRPIPITLRAAGEFPALAAAPPELYDFLVAQSSIQNGTISTRTDPDGRFRFEGLADGQRITLIENDRFCMEPESAQRARSSLVAPCADLVLSLVTRPFVSGRALTSDGQPVAEAMVTLRVASRDGSDRGKSQEQTNADGKFAIPSPIEATDLVEVEVVAPDGSSALRRHDGGFDGELALGDVPLREPRTIRFRARTDTGEPLQRAVAFFADSPQHRSASTDKYGEGTFSFSSDGLDTSADHGLYVHAKGHELGYAAVPTSPNDVAVVTMPRCTRLDVFIEPREISWPAPLYLVAIGQVATPPRELDALAALATVSWSFDRPEPTYRDGHLTFRGEFDAQSLGCALERLAPGIEWRIEVLSPSRELLAETRITLSPGEHAAVPITLPLPRELNGRVVDAAGTAIRRAKVTTTWRDATGAARRADGISRGDGTYTVAGIFGAVVDVIAEHPESGSARRSAIAVPNSGARLELILELSREAVLRVFDSTGAPTSDVRVFVSMFGAESDAAPLETRVLPSETGLFELSNLPRSRVLGRVVLDGRSTPFVIEPEESEKEVRLDAP